VPRDPAASAAMEKINVAAQITRGTARKAIRIYHPDKKFKYGEKWRDICNEVTKVYLDNGKQLTLMSDSKLASRKAEIIFIK
jgi:hypothetical protein